jgi:hypothetical protein
MNVGPANERDEPVSAGKVSFARIVLKKPIDDYCCRSNNAQLFERMRRLMKSPMAGGPRCGRRPRVARPACASLGAVSRRV